MKSATKRLFGIFVKVAGRRDLLQHALVHHRDAARHRQGLVLVVGDHDEGDPDLVLNPRRARTASASRSLASSADSGSSSSSTLRPLDQRAGERDALALAARQLVGLAIDQVLELDQFERLHHPRLALARGNPVDLQAIGDVVATRSCAETRRRTGTPC